MKTRKTDTARARGDWQGMNWLRQEKRLAIYLRDGMACVWCGFAVEEGAKLTIDHLKPHVKEGSNHETNLVTACAHCNNSRGARAQSIFARVVAGYVNHGVTAEQVLGHVRACARRSLKPFKQQATELIAQRGSAAKALAHFATVK